MAKGDNITLTAACPAPCGGAAEGRVEASRKGARKNTILAATQRKNVKCSICEISVVFNLRKSAGKVSRRSAGRFIYHSLFTSAFSGIYEHSVLFLGMPLYSSTDLTDDTRLAIWTIAEPEFFFTDLYVPQVAISHPRKRLEHVAGRFLLTHLFSDFPVKDILVSETKKPYLNNKQFHFSISHSGHYAAALVSKTHNVGMDLQVWDEKLLRIAPKFLNDSEKAFCGNDLQLNTTVWCAKEAAFKWYGRGEVDFSEHMILEPFEAGQKKIRLHFQKPDCNQWLDLEVHLTQDFALVWVVEY